MMLVVTRELIGLAIAGLVLISVWTFSMSDDDELPGFKEGETSREAAEDMRLRAGTLRRLTFEYIRARPGRTADEIAAALKETPWAIRPRVSELRKACFIVNDGLGVNASGKAAHQWRAKGDE